MDTGHARAGHDVDSPQGEHRLHVKTIEFAQLLGVHDLQDGRAAVEGVIEAQTLARVRRDAEPKYRQLEPPARANAVNIGAPRAIGRVDLLEGAVDEQVNLANSSERGVERGLAFRTSQLRP